MLSRHVHEGITWIDLESPVRDEVRSVMSECNLDPYIAEELLSSASRPRAEFYPQYVYLVLHFPVLHHGKKTQEQEVDFIIGKNFLITTHYDVVEPLHTFSRLFEVRSLLHDESGEQHAISVFAMMLKNLYRGIDYEIDKVRRELAAVEDSIFSGNEVAMVAGISHAARNLLHIRQIIEPHREALHALEKEGLAFFGTDHMQFVRALSNDYYRVHNHVMRITESLHELRETNNSLLSTKQNETMKVFTIMAFTTFPLSLIAAVFSMDAKHTPIVGGDNDFWMILGIMVMAAVLMFAFFRRKKWL